MSEKIEMVFLDDEPSYLTAMREGLGNAAERALFCGTQEEALTLLSGARGRDIRLAAVDLRLGKDNGAEVLRRIANKRPDVALVLLTAYAPNPTEQRILDRIGARAMTKASTDVSDILQMGTPSGRHDMPVRSLNFAIEPKAARLRQSMKVARSAIVGDIAKTSVYHLSVFVESMSKPPAAWFRWLAERSGRAAALALARDIHCCVLSSIRESLLRSYFAWLGTKLLLVRAAISAREEDRWCVRRVGFTDQRDRGRYARSIAGGSGAITGQEVVGRLSHKLWRDGAWSEEHGLERLISLLAPLYGKHMQGQENMEAVRESVECAQVTAGRMLEEYESIVYAGLTREGLLMFPECGELGVMPSGAITFAPSAGLIEDVTSPFGIKREWGRKARSLQGKLDSIT